MSDEDHDFLAALLGQTPRLPKDKWRQYTEILACLDRIADAQQCELREPPPSPHVALSDWARQQGVVAEKLIIGPCEFGGYGLYATDDLTENEVAVTVPDTLMMKSDTARRTTLGKRLADDPRIASQASLLLAMHLLEEYRNPASQWAHYINALPRVFSTPLYWTAEHMEFLAGTVAQEAAMGLVRSIARQYINIRAMITKEGLLEGGLTWREFRWAVTTVMTRQNKIPMDDGGDGYALIPFWDMANHEAGGAVTTFYDTAINALVCHAKRSFMQGEHVFINYGTRSSCEFLLYSGFVPHHVDGDTISLPLGLAADDPLHAHKARLLDAALVPLMGPRTLHGTSTLDWETLVFLRVLVMDNATLSTLEHSPDPLGLLSDADGVSKTNERAWLDYMETRIKLLLQRYRVFSDTSSPYAAAAKALVANEKRVLKTTQEVISSIRERIN